ncbi:hypothetical protein BH23VER1_BH23VER1_21930 [soil metagenome]
MKTIQNRGFTLIELLVVITIIAILASLAVPVFSKIQEQGNIVKGTNNVRQIFLGLKLFAGDNHGSYPTGGTANKAFQELVKAQVIDKEDVFGCPNSIVGQPDGDLGTAPSYAEAVRANENHWMMTDGLGDSASGQYPILFEAATSASLDPTWNGSLAGTSVKGRTWSGGKVIVATNDGSVTTYKTANPSADSPLAPLGSGGENVFTRVTIPKILDVEGS